MSSTTRSMKSAHFTMNPHGQTADHVMEVLKYALGRAG